MMLLDLAGIRKGNGQLCRLWVHSSLATQRIQSEPECNLCRSHSIVISMDMLTDTANPAKERSSSVVPHASSSFPPIY